MFASLVGGLKKLIAYAQLTGQPVSLQLAEEQLTDILSANRRRITIDEIQRTVCQFYRVDRTEMASKRRARRGRAARGRWRCTSPRRRRRAPTRRSAASSAGAITRP
jgi:chromosomal replication initiation ATPase DnaA